MKTKWLIIIGLAALVVMGFTRGIAKADVIVCPQVGFSIPIGKYADGLEAGLNFGIAVEYPLSEYVSVGGMINRNRFGVEVESATGRDNVTTAGLFVKRAFAGRSESQFQFYGKVGLFAGAVKTSGSIAGYEIEGSTSICPGMEAMIGILTIGKGERAGFLLEFVYANLYTDGATLKGKITKPGTLAVSTSEEINFNTTWFGVRAGIAFSL